MMEEFTIVANDIEVLRALAVNFSPFFLLGAFIMLAVKKWRGGGYGDSPQKGKAKRQPARQ